MAKGNATLDDIARRAMNEPEFWEQLKGNPGVAVPKLNLSEADARLLRDMMDLHGTSIKIDAEQILTEARRRDRVGLGGGLFWMGRWADKWNPPAP